VEHQGGDMGGRPIISGMPHEHERRRSPHHFAAFPGTVPRPSPAAPSAPPCGRPGSTSARSSRHLPSNGHADISFTRLPRKNKSLVRRADLEKLFARKRIERKGSPRKLETSPKGPPSSAPDEEQPAWVASGDSSRRWRTPPRGSTIEESSFDLVDPRLVRCRPPECSERAVNVHPPRSGLKLADKRRTFRSRRRIAR